VSAHAALQNAGDAGDENRHCEEHRDEAIQNFKVALDCFAELVIGPATLGRTRWLAMTMGVCGGAKSVIYPPDRRDDFHEQSASNHRR
jgi:hypothetical protein